MGGVFSSTARAIRSVATRLTIGSIADGQVLTRVGTTVVGAAAGAADADVVHKTGAETVAGVKTFTSDPLIPDEVYGVGWNGSLEPPTKNAVYDKVETLGGAGYLKYVALLTQTGTSAPVATVLENTLGGAVVWARTALGVYTATLTGAFTASKTVVFTTGTNGGANTANRTSDNVVTLSTYSVLGTAPEDELLVASTIEIRVYP